MLLERERELDRLAARLDAAAGGEGGLVMVEGAPGLGKTSLLRAAAQAGEERGFEVLRARGAELERQWPFGAVRQLLEPALRSRLAESRDALLAGAAELALPVLVPERAGATAVDASFGTLHGLYWLCANLAAQRPILLVIDDAHWLDEASLRFLGVLSRRIDAVRMLIVVAQRPSPPRPLAELGSDPQTEAIALRELSVAGTEALLATWSPAGPLETGFALACQRATAGNPFLLSRLAAGLRDQGIAFTAANAGRVEVAGVEAVRDAVAAALGRLDASALALAEAVAVLEDDADLTLAAELAGIDRPEAAAEALVGAGVLEDARPLRFVHAIVRDAVAARLSAGVRVALHARAAELLAGRHAAPEAIAVHLLPTEPRARPWVVDHLAAAARRALDQGAPEAAITSLHRALDEPPPPAQEAELVLELARAQSRLGHQAARECFQRAYDRASDPLVRARAAIELVWAGAGPAIDESAVAQLEQSIDEIQEGGDLALELRAAHLSAIQILGVRPEWAARERQRWAALEGRTDGERLLLAQLAIGQMQVGGPARTCADFARRAVADAGFEAIAGGELSLMLAIIALYKADDLDATERVLAREMRSARERGSRSGYAIVCNFSAAVALRRGHLASAEADARAGLDAIPLDAWQGTQLSSALLDALVETGRLDEAQAILTDNRWDDHLPDMRSTNVLLSSRARLRRAQGDDRQALADALESRRRTARVSTAVDTNWNGWARIALLHHTLGDTQAARREAAEFLAVARRWDTPAAIGQALATNGLIEGGGRGLALLAKAVDHLERSPARLLLAEALIDYGAALRRAGHRAQAREPLRRGLDIAAPSGATPLTERAHRELTASGVRVRRHAQTGIAALTPSERRVAEHAAAGATNPQIAQALFVTVKTVEMHLSNVFRKLDINSRHQLPADLVLEAPAGAPGSGCRAPGRGGPTT